MLGIPHSLVNLQPEFVGAVIEPFAAAYAGGVTPNPCILCNRNIKFPALLRIARQRNAAFIATGHYARVERGAGSPPVLKKGVDRKKDQSYVLYVLNRETLDRLLLPLGGMRKDEVRATARALGMPAAQRPESQEICFVEDRFYFRFVEDITGGARGPLIDSETGAVLGSHGGIHLYTVGQRKRLGIAAGTPRYVVRIDPLTNAVYVGPKEAALMREFLVEDLNWLREGVAEQFRAAVKVRSTMNEEPASLTVVDGVGVKVVYDEPQWAPAPGQSAVFYEGEAVTGGGVISRCE